MGSFAGWLRHHSEENLMAVTQEELARRYLGRDGPVGRPAQGELFWRRVFVPTYRRLPWRIRRFALHRMPGSHRQRWQWRGGT
ncbi:MAG: hypothetical protein ACRDN9_12075 [Streptosporangiaceae bacterium]